MANDLSKSMSNIPAHIAALMGGTALASPADNLSDDLSSGLSQGGVPRISLKASRFRIVENGAEIRLRETELPVIIVGANKGLSKTYYAKAWDPDDEPAAPDCWSMDGVRPDDSIADPMNDKCATCPKNQWGSKLTPAGKQIKACADQKRLAVVAADDPGTVYLVQVTPAALQGLVKYNAELKARGLRPDWVVTMLSFDPDASFPKLVFGFGGFPTAEALEAVSTLDADEIARVATGDLTIVPQQKSIAAPKEEPEVKAKRKAAVVEEEEDEPAPKPKRRMARQPVEEVEDEPAPVAKAKPKAKPAVVEDDEDDDATIAAFAKAKPKPKAKVVEEEEDEPAPRPKKARGAVIEDNDDEPAPKQDKRMSGLVGDITARLGTVHLVDDEEEDDDA